MLLKPVKKIARARIRVTNAIALALKLKTKANKFSAVSPGPLRRYSMFS